MFKSSWGPLAILLFNGKSHKTSTRRRSIANANRFGGAASAVSGSTNENGRRTIGIKSSEPTPLCKDNFMLRPIRNPARLLATIVFSLAASITCSLADDVDKPVSLNPIRYQNRALQVDLGVGLWAWPMPFDWDNDGDLDLVVSCPDVPYRGIYFFENPGGSSTPIFKPAVKVGQGQTNIGLSWVDGKPRILAAGVELIDVRKTGFNSQKKIYATSNLHANKVRANQWRYVDYDADGALDLAVGVGDWTDYGWDNAYNDKGQWTRGPLRGFVYLLRNEGTTDAPSYAEPTKLLAGDKPIDVFGMPSPNFADFDGDGDLDLICGEFLDGFHYFQNTGSRTRPRYAKSQRLGVKMDLQMIVPTAVDWDGDGDVDLICGDEDGRVAWIEHTGRVEDGTPVFNAPKYFQQEADEIKFGALVTPVSIDWDGDGDEDLICGNTAGYIGFFENLNGGNPPKFAAVKRLQAGGRTLRIMAGENGSIQGPAEAKWGYTTLSVADWDHDGLLDLVVNSIWGKVVWYRNVGSQERAQLELARDVEVEWSGSPPQPAWNWWKPQGKQLATQWRTTPVVVDLDGDALNDLVMLDHEGYLVFFQRERDDSGQLKLKPGHRLFTDANGRPLRLNNRDAGGSGRRKLCLADWDGDGKIDILLNSSNVELWRNVSTKQHAWAFQNQGNMHAKRLAGHTTSPTVVDWNRDGKPELLVGAEDGRLYYMAHRKVGMSKQTVAGLTIEAREIRFGSLGDGKPAYSNRAYTWFDVPESLNGRRTIQTAGGEPPVVFVSSPKECELQLATAKSNQTPGKAGWKRVPGAVFGYTDRGKTRMQVWRKKIKAGERTLVPQGSWTGGILILPE